MFLVAVASYLFLALINSTKGFRYLGIMLCDLIVLIASAYFNLSGIHLFAQGAMIVLLVTLPIVFHQEWIAALDKSNEVRSRDRVIGWPALVLIALAAGALVTLLGNGVTTKTGKLPQQIVVDAVNLPEGLTANLGSNSKVELVISAPRDKWSSITDDSFSATVDVANQKEGTYDLPVNITSKVADVVIRRINPSRMVVNVEPIIVKTVPVVAKYSGKAGNDLVPDVPVFTPDKVEVSGPKSVVTTMTQAVAAINIEGATAKIDQKFTLVGQTPDGEIIPNITFNPFEVSGAVNLIKAGKLKTVGIRPAITGQPASGFWVNQIIITPTAVTVTGPVDTLDALTQINTENISVNGQSADNTQTVNLAFPSGITSADNTSKVTVKVTFSSTQSMKTTTPTINYMDVNGSLKVTSIDPASVSVLVAGPSGQLSTVDGQIAINLPLSAYKSAGTYSVTITKEMITLPSGVSLVSFLPSAIDVKLDNK